LIAAMRNPTRLQYFFASNWPFYIWLGAGVVVGSVVVIRACDPSFSSLQDWRFLLSFILAVLAAPFLGFFVSVILAAFILPPVYQVIGQLNGGPYAPGDSVQILTGINRGQIVTVEKVWAERYQVCLPLPESGKAIPPFAYSYTQVRRVSPQQFK
jgi:hypothetical protein